MKKYSFVLILMLVATWCVSCSKEVVPGASEWKSLHETAEAHYQAERHEQSIEVGQEALKTVQPTGKAAVLMVSDSLVLMGKNYAALKRYEDALNAYRASLAHKQKYFKPDDPVMLKTLNALAQFMALIQQVDKVEKYLGQALQIIESKGRRAPRLQRAETLLTWGDFLMRSGKQDKAEPFLKQAEALYGQDPVHLLGMANTKKILSLLYLGQMRLIESYAEGSNALEIMRDYYGDKPHKDIVFMLKVVGNSLYFQGEQGLGLGFYEEALHVEENMLGAEHPDIARWLMDLHETYAEMELFDKAEAAVLRAIEIYKKAYGPDDSRVRKSTKAYESLQQVIKK